LRGPQLTPYGFFSLKNDLEERQPSLLLWNETLLTVSKVEDQIYVLLNDISLLSTHTDAVWERLREGNDDGYFVDCNFMPTNSLIQSNASRGRGASPRAHTIPKPSAEQTRKAGAGRHGRSG
jgi:hypothetical protein